MAISTAIGSERRSRVSGYRIMKGFFDTSSPNLPQQILIVGSPNTANAPTVDYTKMKEVVSAREAGELFGFGSPIYQAMRILRPLNSDGVGGIPTFVLPLENNGIALKLTFAISGTATKSGTHTVVINGRESIDGYSYAFEIMEDDTASNIALKMADAINGNIYSPFTAVATTSNVELTAKYKGEISNDLNVSINASNDLGVTYALTTTTAGAGVSNFLRLEGALSTTWITAIVNGDSSDLFHEFERINGVPYLDNPTGRYTPYIFKPFMAYTGITSTTVLDYTTLAATSTNVGQCTNVICPAPGSLGTRVEAAANVVRLFARTMQDTPEKDVNGMAYPDMPISQEPRFPMFTDYNQRDLFVKNGISNVTFENNQFLIQDLVTTYHVEGEFPYQFGYARNLNLDWNVKDAYTILEKRALRDKVILRDNDFSDSTNTIKPKEWKGIVYGLFDDLVNAALISDAEFSKQSLRIEVDSVNKDRFNTFFRYRRTGIARIVSTDVEAGF